MSSSGSFIVGRYAVLGRIARGGTSNVLLAVPRDNPNAPRVVLKRLYTHLAENEEFVRMFVDEVRLMALLRHRGVVDVIDLDEDGETFFAVLELVDGPSVSAALRLLKEAGARCPVDAAVAVAARVAEALQVVHALRDPDSGEPLDLVHRDVAPQNVLVAVDGRGQGVVKIADFGLARSAAGRKSGLMASRDTQAGWKKGRASLLAPEQVKGSVVDQRADLWALGVTLSTMIVGAPPFAGAVDADLFDAILHAPTPRLLDARRDVAAIDDADHERLLAVQVLLDELLDKDAAARPPSAAAVAARLRAIVPADNEDAAVAALVASLGLPSLRA
jgi:serine/threonine-protein kinase